VLLLLLCCCCQQEAAAKLHPYTLLGDITSDLPEVSNCEEVRSMGFMIVKLKS
jgi:hypothetical protein